MLLGWLPDVCAEASGDEVWSIYLCFLLFYSLWLLVFLLILLLGLLVWFLVVLVAVCS